MAAPLLAVIGGVGVALNAYGQWKQGQDQSQSLLSQAYFKELEAQELLRRNEINNDLYLQDAQQLIGEQINAASLSNIGGASTLAMYEQTAMLAARQLRRNTEEAEWNARALRMEANSMGISARNSRTAGNISALGTVAKGAADIYKNSPGNYSTEGLSVLDSSNSSTGSSTVGVSRGGPTYSSGF
jgi:hypothetical protein